jgi:hypothetical protein
VRKSEKERKMDKIFDLAGQRIVNKFLLTAKFHISDRGVIEIWKFRSLEVLHPKGSTIDFCIKGNIFWKGLCEPAKWGDLQRCIEPFNRKHLDPLDLSDPPDPSLYLKCSLFFLAAKDLSNKSRFLTLKERKPGWYKVQRTANIIEIDALREEALVLEDIDELIISLGKLLPLMGVPFIDVKKIVPDIKKKVDQ